MDAEAQMRLAYESQKLLHEQSEKRYLESSKERLLNIITKKMRTIMIGSLDDFEKAFGFLWGANKSFNQLSKEEKEFRIIWESTRKKVLDRGNDQIRAAETESNYYTVKWERFKKVLPVSPKPSN